MKSLKRFNCPEAKTLELRRAFLQVDPSKPLSDPVNSELLRLAGLLDVDAEKGLSGSNDRGRSRSIRAKTVGNGGDSNDDNNNDNNNNNNLNTDGSDKDVDEEESVVVLELDMKKRLMTVINSDKNIPEVIGINLTSSECYMALDIVLEMLDKEPTSKINPYLLQHILSNCFYGAAVKSYVKLIEAYCASSILSPNLRSVESRLPQLPVVQYMPLKDLKYFAQKYPALFNNSRFVYEYLKKIHPQSTLNLDIKPDVCRSFYSGVLEELKGTKTPTVESVIDYALCGILAIDLLETKKHYDVELFKEFVENHKTFVLSNYNKTQLDNSSQKRLVPLLSQMSNVPKSIDFCNEKIVRDWNLSRCGDSASLPLFNPSFHLFRNTENMVVKPYLEYIVFSEVMNQKNELPDDGAIRKFLFESEWIKFFPFETLVKTILNVVSVKSHVTTMQLFEKYRDFDDMDKFGVVMKKELSLDNTPKISVESDLVTRKLTRNSRLNFVVTSKFIRMLNVEVYEISLFDLLKSGKDRPSDIFSMKLEGRHPTFSDTLEIPKDIQDWRTIKTLVSITPSTERSLLIVVVSGSGISVRVMAQIGHVHPVTKLTQDGYLFNVLDEEGKPINNCALHIGGTRFTQLQEPIEGDEIAPILVPYRNPKEITSSSCNVIIEVPNNHFDKNENILLKEDLKGDCDLLFCVERKDSKRIPIIPYAVKENITYDVENYDFTTKMYVDEQSATNGSTGAARCHGKITLNGKVDVPISIINGGRIDVILTDTRGATDITTYSNLEEVKKILDGEKGLSFRIIDELQSISINVDVQLTTRVTKEKKTLSSSSRFDFIDDKESTTSDIPLECTLTYISSRSGVSHPGYALAVLDPSGTPQKNYPLTISAHSIYSNAKIETNAKTDKNGLVYLGELSEYSNISVSWKTGEPDNTIHYALRNTAPVVEENLKFSLDKPIRGSRFKIPTFFEPHLPEPFETVVGRKVYIPIVHDDNLDMTICCLGFSETVFERTEESDYDVISKQGEIFCIIFKKDGEYSVYYRQNHKDLERVNVTVGKELVLNNEFSETQYCKKDDKVTKLSKQRGISLVPIASYFNPDSECYILSMSCDAESNDTYTAFATSYKFQASLDFKSRFANEYYEDTDSLILNYNRPNISQEAKLSEESEYMRRRRDAEEDGTKRIGCSLHRPGIILNRRKETSVKSEHREAEKGGNIVAKKESAPVPDVFGSNSRVCKPKAPRVATGFCFQREGGKAGEGYNKNNIKARDYLPIRNDSLILENLGIMKTGNNTFDIAIPASKVSDSAFVGIIVRDNFDVSTYISLAIGGDNEDNLVTSGFRDLKLSECRDRTKHYVEKITTSCSSPESNTRIDHAGEREVAIYSSFPDYIKLTRAVLNSQKSKEALRRLEKLEQWGQLNTNEKKEFIKGNLCHEVELFLYFKDPSFFASIVYPLICSKIQPDFIDTYLIYAAPRHLRNQQKFAERIPDLSKLSTVLKEKLLNIAVNMEEVTKLTPIEAIFLLDFIYILSEECEDEISEACFKKSYKIVEDYLISSTELHSRNTSERERIERIALNVGSVGNVEGGLAPEENKSDDSSDSSWSDSYSSSSGENESDDERMVGLKCCDCADDAEIMEKNEIMATPNGMTRGTGLNSFYNILGPVGYCANDCIESQKVSMPTASFSMGVMPQQQMILAKRASFGRMAARSANKMSYEHQQSKKIAEPRFQVLSVTTLFSEMKWLDVGACGLDDSNGDSAIALSQGAHLFAKEGWNAFWLDFCHYYIPNDKKKLQISKPFTTTHFLEPLLSGSYTEAFVAYSVLSSSVVSVSIKDVIHVVPNGGDVDWIIKSPNKDFFTASHIIAKQIVSINADEAQAQLRNKKEEEILVIVKQRIKPFNGTTASNLNELYVNTHYVTEYTIINLSDSSINDDNFQIITQIPQGAVPLKRWNNMGNEHSGSYSKTANVKIHPLGSTNISMHYFFPIPGEYQLPCAVVSSNGLPVGSSEKTAKILDEMKNGKTDKQEREGENKVMVKAFAGGVASSVMSNGVVFANMLDKEVIEWIKTSDLRAQFPKLKDLAHLEKDDPISKALHQRLIASKDFYRDVSQALRERGWSSLSLRLIGLHHGEWDDIRALADYIINCASRKSISLKPMLFSLSSKILKYSPFDDASHFVSTREKSGFTVLTGGDRLCASDFDPLVNERFFRLGREQTENSIENKELEKKYKNLLLALSIIPPNERPAEYKIWIAYYMLLQNRISEAAQLLSDKKEEVLGYAKILSDTDSVSIQQHIPYLQLCCLMSYIELSIIDGSIDKDISVAFPISSALSKIPSNSFVFATIFGRYIHELMEYMTRLSGSSVRTEETESGFSEEEVKPISYGKTVSTSIKADDECSTIKISVPVAEASQVSVMFYHIDWEALLVSSDGTEVSALLPKDSGRKKGIIIEQIDADETISFLIPEHCSELELGNEDESGLCSADISVPEELRRIPFIVGVRTSVSKVHYFRLMPQVLKIVVEERTGVLRVIDRSGKAVIGCYIRVMANKSSPLYGFWKDGYTDLVGRFDYATVSTQEISSVRKFLIYAERKDVGCTLKKADPPDV